MNGSGLRHRLGRARYVLERQGALEEPGAPEQLWEELGQRAEEHVPPEHLELFRERWKRMSPTPAWADYSVEAAREVALYLLSAQWEWYATEAPPVGGVGARLDYSKLEDDELEEVCELLEDELGKPHRPPAPTPLPKRKPPQPPAPALQPESVEVAEPVARVHTGNEAPAPDSPAEKPEPPAPRRKPSELTGKEWLSQRSRGSWLENYVP